MAIVNNARGGDGRERRNAARRCQEFLKRHARVCGAMKPRLVLVLINSNDDDDDDDKADEQDQ